MVIGLSLVVVECRYTFHIVPSAKFLCEIFKYLLRLIGGVNFGQGNYQFPCFDTLPRRVASLKFLLTFFCKVSPKGIVCGAVSGIEVFLSCMACNIRYSSLDIGQLRHLNKAVACHKSSPFCVVKVLISFATDLSVAAVLAAGADETANENCGSNFLCIIAAVYADKL